MTRVNGQSLTSGGGIVGGVTADVAPLASGGSKDICLISAGFSIVSGVSLEIAPLLIFATSFLFPGFGGAVAGNLLLLRLPPFYLHEHLPLFMEVLFSGSSCDN